LFRAHLEHANLSEAHLEHANLSEAHLEHANLYWTHLEHANLSDAHLERANMIGCNLARAYLPHARLEHAYLNECNLDHAHLNKCNLEHANLSTAHLDHTDLRKAQLSQAILKEAILTGADVRGATGLRFDTNRVRDIHIEGNAHDPWSVLRRTYTGPMFFVHAALLVAFILPYVGKVVVLTAIDRATRATDSVHDPLQFLADRVGLQVESIPAWKVLIGLDKGPLVPALGLVLLLYNVIRGVLTIKVGQLRDAEERSGITPTLKEYMGTQGLTDERWPFFIVPLVRECGRWLLDKALNAVRWRKERTSHFADLGLWRLHRVLQILLWFAIASFAVHAVIWVWTTAVPLISRQTDAPSPDSPNAPATPTPGGP
jgi:uncharacterized protein YjbI with pentapeptide repeats